MTLAKTFIPKPKPEDRKWVVVDAKDRAPGRIAADVAKLLLGKDKATFTPHLDNGSGVIVINASQVAPTGRKLEQKFYTRFSGYPSGLKRVRMQELKEQYPERIIEHAVKGMLPHNRLGRALMRHLRVVRNAEHPHNAQLGGRSHSPKTKKSEGKTKGHGTGSRNPSSGQKGQQAKKA